MQKGALKVIVLSAAFFLLLPNFVSAAPSWWPLVPCGTSVNPEPCNPCELFHLGRNIIDFVLMGLMPPVAAGLFIWGGFLILMGGANPALLSRGKEIFKTTFYGVLVILASWLITNTIMMSVAQDSIEITKADGTKETVNIVTDWNKFKCTYTEQGTTSTTGDLTISPDTLPDVIPDQYYSQAISVSGGQSPYDWSATDASSLPGGFSFDDGQVYGQTAQTTGSFTFTAQVKDSTSPTPLTGSKTYSLTIGTMAGLTCNVQGLVLGSCSDAGKCPDCKPISGTSLQAAQSMADFLNGKLLPAFNSAGIGYRIAEAMCPTDRHNSCAHFNGHAVDLGGLSGENLKKACGILNSLGMSGATSAGSGDRGRYTVEISSPGSPCPATCGGNPGRCGASPIHLQY
ncbi:MAG: hypothetical protein A2746_00665 [Candidatus Yanofskybacteria bacterium RIFCSPHIGHO2_01_FULL_44_22]|uniref:Uncharacterized protein n=2 Tax=Candidatus Yanofskyibacteriota TaxID=1752733 RepID=A0A1F8EYA6_9BACT|nr:MAG: hypothetical protein A2746_00665 [Candidatus Yanofskybacteria bacterium RIFCSPHIGHO2_01_FULL_44_22]